MQRAESAPLQQSQASIFASDDSRRPSFVKYFGLRENPFRSTSDPRYLLLTTQARNALDGLMRGINAREGLLVLTGEVGAGKTVLLNSLLDLLRQRGMPRAFIFNSHLEANELFEMALADFGVPPDPRTHANPSVRLQQWLTNCYRANSNPVLIVDEAQGLKIEVLEAIRMLLNLESGDEKLLQVVLSGQPEFDTKINSPELRQLRQRIAFRYRLSAMTVEETCLYIEHRLRVAGSASDCAFEPEALAAIHYYARGTPRVINALCEQALVKSCAERTRPVQPKTIEEVAFQLQIGGSKPLSAPVELVDSLMKDAVAAQSKRARALFAVAASASVVAARSQSEPRASAQPLMARKEPPSDPIPSPIETATTKNFAPAPRTPVAVSAPMPEEPVADSRISAPAPTLVPKTSIVTAAPTPAPVHAEAKAQLPLLAYFSSIRSAASDWFHWLRQPMRSSRGTTHGETR